VTDETRAVTDETRDGPGVALSDPADRQYVESLPAGVERDAVVASLLRHRSPETLQVGDPLPDATLLRPDDLEPVEVKQLLGGGRPLLLVFGSFT
jgi:hypothetical protein